MDKSWNLRLLDNDEHVARLKSGLSEAREQARAQQNTLNNILLLLQRLPVLDLEGPRNPNQITELQQLHSESQF
jgi:hypothetical protein